MTSERRAWTEFVEKREAEKKATRPRGKKPEVRQAELEQALDDLTTEARAIVDRTNETAQPRRTRAVVCSGGTRSEKAFVSQCAPEIPIGATSRQKVLQYQRTA